MLADGIAKLLAFAAIVIQGNEYALLQGIGYTIKTQI